MPYCAQCGAELKDEDEFCPKCGHHNESKEPVATPPEISRPVATAAVAPVSTSAPGAPATSGKKLSGCAIAAIIGGSFAAVCGAILVLVLVLAFSITTPAVDALEAHLEALKRGNIEEAYQGTSAAFRDATSLDDYRRFIDSYPVLKDVAETGFSERTVENGVATLKGSITDSQGNSTALNAQLLQEGDAWMIQLIDLPNPPAPNPAASSNGSTNSVVTANSLESSVGPIVIGAGRNTDGSLVNPGQPIPVNAPTISADIALINHPAGERVQVWVEQGENRTEPIDGVIEGTGSGNMPFELHLGNSQFPPGRYTLVVSLGETKRFTQDFEIR